MNLVPRFCSQCGASLNPGDKFCPQCGRSIVVRQVPAPAAPASPPVAYPAAPPAPAPQPAYQQAGEPILGIVPLVERRKGFLGMGSEVFNIVITPHRLIFAAVSKQQIQQAIAAARSGARSEGKGFFGQFAAQMRWANIICQEYTTMPPNAILSRYPGSFNVANAAIKKVRLRNVQPSEDSAFVAEVIIDTTAGKHKFTLKGMALGEARRILQQTLGPVVK